LGVANVLVMIELGGDRPAESSLECLGEARRIASFLGATLHAIVPCVSPPRFGDDDVIAELGRHGADKVVLVTGPHLGSPLLWATHGAALASACDRVPPALLLGAATAGGRDLLPRLAARLGAAFVPEPSIEYGPRGELVLSRTVYGGAYRRRLAADDIERPVVATITAGSYLKASGSQEAEMLALPQAQVSSPLVEVSQIPDPGQGLDSARVIVTAGAGVAKEHFGLIEALARALGGEVAVTADAAERGLGGVERQIGVDGRTVAPRLYVAVGASGSPAHLGAVSSDATIVAINTDPDAPIFRVATYGLVGRAETVLPQLISAVQKPPAEKAS
jgi:electron transfer flavoprotein alpha subunit